MWITATALPATVVAPGGAEPSPLCDKYAGVLKSTDVRTGENVSARSIDVRGLPVETNHTVTRYERPVLIVAVSGDTPCERLAGIGSSVNSSSCSPSLT